MSIFFDTLVTPNRVTKRMPKYGRPTVRKDGIPLTAAEKQARYRARLRRARKRRGINGWYEWFTPAEYIEAARTVLGVVDLDPATHKKAQEIIKATKYFTKDDDGLQHEWHGRVWLNPPYSRDLIAKFIDKLLLEISAGRTQQAILLVNAYTDTQWFRRAATESAAICFTKRIKFWSFDGRLNKSPPQGQALLYYGSDVECFQAAFKSFGIIR